MPINSLNSQKIDLNINLSFILTNVIKLIRTKSNNNYLSIFKIKNSTNY
jgi:hypothetical protein